MAQICRLELQTEIKSSPDRIFDIYKNKTSLMPKISPDKLKSIEVLEGDGKSVGSVRLWTYVMGGAVIAKDKIVAIDEEKGSMTFDLIGGEVTNYYKSFKATIEATSEAHTNLVKWSLEYEKANETVPSPESHLAFLLDVSKERSKHLLMSSLKSSGAKHTNFLISALIKHKVEVHEGDWETQGSVKHWSYTIGGNSVSIKETMESMDEENRSITFGFGWGGAERLQELQVHHASDTKGGEGCLVKWTAEYEKASEDGPDPHDYLELTVNVIKDIESHLLNA